MGTILASQPASVGGVLDQAFRLFRAGVPRLLPFTLTTAVTNILVQLIQSARAIGRAAGMPALAEPAVGLILVGMLLGLAAYVLQLVAYSGAIHRVGSLDAGTGSTADSWRGGARRAPTVFFAGFLIVLMVGIPGGLTAAAVVGLWRSVLHAAAVLLAVIAVACLFYVIVRLLLVGQEVVLRSRPAGAAISSSWRLTRGHFWRLTLIFMVMGFVIVALFLTVGFAVGALLGALLAGAHVAPIIAATATAVILSFITVITVPFSLGVSIAIWHDLLLRSEGGDLAQRIDALPAGT